MYDYVIIGGGISGLYALQELHKQNPKYRILLCDERSYMGGRLLTHANPQYEIGGARFHNNHKLLLSLIRKHKCTKIPLTKTSLFLEQTRENNIVPYYDVGETLASLMSQIIKDSKKHSKQFLQEYSLASYITHQYKDKTLTHKIKDIFGYYSEIEVMNAYDALVSFEEDFLSKQFYILKEGFTALCERMCAAYDSKVNIEVKKNTRIVRVEKQNKNDCYVVHSEKNKYECAKIIFAIKAPQLRAFSLLKPIHPLLSCIHGAPLLRIYAKYPKQKNKVWFDGFPKIITNNILRQIIPIDRKSGLIMISYSDGKDIDPFLKNKNKLELRDKTEVQNIIARELKNLFPSYTIPKPTYFNMHLWTLGCHHWKPGCDSSHIIKKVQTPLPGVYVVGEAFSHKQAWMEGALESVECVKSLF